jgi:two-component system OmpR family response regulator/two-component system response regulator QseB
MPGMNGIELLSRLAALPGRIPAIVVSAHDSPEERRKAADCGAVAFFGKPFDPARLLEAIASVIRAESESTDAAHVGP